MRTVRSWLSVCTNGAALALPALACVLGAGATVAGAMPADTGSVAALAASCGTDEFDGAALDDARWDVLRPAGTGPSVSGGKLNLELRNTDLIGGTATAENLVLQDAPDGGWTATTTLDTAAIDENGEQAGLVLWKSEGPPALNNAFGKVVAIRNNAGAYKYEAIWTDGGGLAIPIADSGADVPALPAQATIRLRSDGETVTAEYRDGDTWRQIGRPAKYDAPLRVGAVALRGSGGSGTVAYENFALTCGPEVTLSASKLTGTAPLAVDFTSTVSDAAADVDWRFGDGGTADGGATQSHTFTEPGTYRVRVRAENAAGDTTVESVRVVVGDGQPPQLGDEFVGNELDPKWEILRPRATLRSVSDGALRLGNAGGDMHGTNASAPNVLLQTLPETPAVASTQIDVSNLVNGGDQVGMVVWRSESPNHFAKVVYNRRSATEYWFERSRTDNGGTTGGNTGTVVGSPQKIQIRIASSGGANPTFTPERSVDGGQTWAAVQPAFSLAGTGPVKVGLTFFSGNTLRTAAFDWFRVGTPECIANGTPEAGFSRLWNGVSLDGTAQAGLGGFNVVSDGAEGCRLVSTGGMGMLWFNTKQYDNFVLRAQFKTADATDNSGIFVRFPNPGNDPYVAINNGHEIQVREGVQGDGEDQKTGSVYNFDREDKRAGKAPGQWNDYEIRYEAGKYTITLNGEVVNEWQNNLQQGKTGGYIGLQNHGPSDEVSFRNLRIQELTSTTTNLFTTIGITRSETRQNSGIFGTPTRYSLPAEEMPPSRTVGPAPNDTVDNVPLRMPDTSGTQPNLAAFNGQTLTLRDQDRKQYSKIHFFGMTTDGGPAGGDFLLRYADDSTQTINVQFRDWCGPQNTPAHHQAIGPLTKRHREVGEDGARCGIYHVPADAQAGKTLVSVTLPSSTSPGEPPIQSYLMALTLEEPGGFFETPDLSGTVAFPDDEKAPVTTHALNPGAPNGNDGWYAGPVRVTLTAEDEDGGSGVERMMYRVDGGAPQPYTGAFDFAVEGEHTLEYASIDGAGNAEGYKSVTLKVDPSAPATGARTTPRDPLGIDGWHDGAVTLTLTPRDGQGSGAEQTEYRIDGGGWQEYDGPVVIDAAGIHDVEYFSTDVAGNEEEPASLRVKIDRTAPVTTARINGAAPLAEYTGPVRIAFTRTDGDGSGAIATEYRIGDGAWTDYTGAFDVDGLRGHRVDFRSRDHAGNVENFKTVMFVIRPAPVALGTPPPPATAPKPAPFAALQPLSRKRSTVAALRRGELAVRVSCQGVDAGTVRLTVSRALARKLGLKSRLLAKGTVRCGAEGRANVTLEPRAKVKRALAHRKGAVAATLALRMGETNDSAAVVLRGSR